MFRSNSPPQKPRNVGADDECENEAALAKRDKDAPAVEPVAAAENGACSLYMQKEIEAFKRREDSVRLGLERIARLRCAIYNVSKGALFCMSKLACCFCFLDSGPEMAEQAMAHVTSGSEELYAQLSEQVIFD